MKERQMLKALSLLFAAGLMLFVVGATPAMAAVSKDEKKLNTDVTELDKMAGQPQGAKVVTERLEKTFNVTDTQITTLRNEGLGFGEIAIVFSLAQKLGGITDTNISKIMALRQGPPVMGWGEIAQKLGVKLGPVVSQVHKVETGSHKEISKLEEKTEHGKSGMEERHEGFGSTERMERPAGGHVR